MTVLVIWIINTRVLLVVDLDLDLICFLQILHIKNYSLLHCMFSIFFYPKMIKPNIMTFWISSLQNWPNHRFSSTTLHFKSGIIEGSHEIKQMTCFLSFGPFS